MLRSVIEKNSQKMKATYQGMSKGIDTSGLWIPTQKVKRQRTTKIIGQNSEDFDLHFADLLFSVSIISDVHEIADFRSIHFLILGSNEHGSHTHQLQVFLFNFASGMLQVPEKKIILTLAKDQLNSEWIYEVCFSQTANQKLQRFLPYQTNKNISQKNCLPSPKNHQKKCYDPYLYGRAEILVIFGMHFGRNDDLKNSFRI